MSRRQQRQQARAEDLKSYNSFQVTELRHEQHTLLLHRPMEILWKQLPSGSFSCKMAGEVHWISAMHPLEGAAQLICNAIGPCHLWAFDDYLQEWKLGLVVVEENS